MSARSRFLLATAALCVCLPLGAAVPNEDAQPAYAEEQTVLQAEHGTPEPGWLSSASGRQHFDRHFIEPPGRMPEQDVVLQRGGNTWRVLRNGPAALLAGTLLTLTLLGVAVAWRVIGPARTPPESGRLVHRFSRWDRLVHWTTALSFIGLALTGLITLFGKNLILPWLGHTAFSWLAVVAKYVHNVVGPLFIVFSLVMFFTFLQRNHFGRVDWQWVRRAGGAFGGGPVPAGYFNAGEKLWFWFGVTLLGLLMAATGLVLDFPYWGRVGDVGGSTRYVQQWANLLHLAGATLFIAAAIGHTYLGTAGTPGTYRGMRHGDVDEAWARRHHALWLAQLQGDAEPDPRPASAERTRPAAARRRPSRGALP